MTRESRMLLVLAAFGIGAIAVLMAMAQRYSKMLEPAAAPGARPRTVESRPAERVRAGGGTAIDATARRRVTGFLAVRRELLEAIGEQAPEGVDQLDEDKLSALRTRRDAAAARLGLSPDDYRKIRDQYRIWLRGERPADPATARALEDAREQLEAAAVGDFERFDL